MQALEALGYLRAGGAGDADDVPGRICDIVTTVLRVIAPDNLYFCLDGAV